MHTYNALVSIIVPTYNRAHVIGETLQSVKNQTYQNWECIIVDDFSTDHTCELINQLSLEDQRFNYLSNQRTKGAPGARNTGLYAARGEFIIFLDSDDLILEKCLENRIRYFKINPLLDIVISLQKRKENGVETFYINQPSDIHPLIRFYSLSPNIDIPWLNNSLLIKKSFILTNKIEWDESVQIHQDIQFNVSLLANNPNIKWSNDTYDSYWVYNDNVDNIGRNIYDNLGRIKKLNEIYGSNLKNPKIDKQLNAQLKKQFHAYVISVSYELAFNPEIRYNDYLSFITYKTSLPWIDEFLLKVFGRLYKVHKRFYLHRFLSKKIKDYLKKKYQPVIKEGYFLKLKELEKIHSKVF